MMFGVGIGRIQQITAEMHISKLPYAQTVARVQLRLQKLAAGVPHFTKLQVGGGRQ